MDGLKKEEGEKVPKFFAAIKDDTVLAMVEILNMSQIDPKLLDVISNFMV